MVPHFVLIHGVNHGAWAWYKLQHRLQERGCRVTAMDMRSAGADMTNPRSITSLTDYSQPLLDFLHSLPEDLAPHHKVVLVAHSLGGLTVSLAMEKYSHKIGLAIFVAAVCRPVGRHYQTLRLMTWFESQPPNPFLCEDTVYPRESLISIAEWYYMRSGSTAKFALAILPQIFKDTILSKKSLLSFGNGADKPPTLFTIPTHNLQDIWYSPDVPQEDIVLASHLIKWFPLTVPGTPVTFTKEKHGPSVYIKYLKDQTLLPQAQDSIIENHGPFSEVIEIDCGHFNFWPKIDEFTRLILGLADKYITRKLEE